MKTAKILSLIIAVVFIASMLGCAPAAAPATQAPAAPATQAPAPKTFGEAKCGPNCAYKDMVMCFPQLGAESDWRTADTASFKDEATKDGFQLVFSDAQQKEENQLKAVRSFIAQLVDAIIIATGPRIA